MNNLVTSGTTLRNTRLSRALRGVGALAAGSWAGAVVAAVVTLWLIAFALKGFPAWMAAGLQTVAAAITLAMVFVIQHAQRRSETAMHLKLDALIRASDADDELAAVEHATGDELEQRLRREVGLDGDGSGGSTAARAG